MWILGLVGRMGENCSYSTVYFNLDLPTDNPEYTVADAEIMVALPHSGQAVDVLWSWY